MRSLWFLLLLSCGQVPHKRFPAMVNAPGEVARIEIELRDQRIFASGYDSTFLTARIFDQSNQLVTVTDPNELELMISEDLEAKPFSLKQGVYRAEIKPRVKSPDIELSVDWKGLVRSNVLTLQTGIGPFRDSMVPLRSDFNQCNTIDDVDVCRSSASPERFTDSIHIQNDGKNRIVSAPDSQRSFEFSYEERARQNVMLEVDDAPNEYVSHTMSSVLMFFPRRFLPVVEQKEATLVVTIPTGEEIVFDKASKQIVGGVIEEGPVDIGPDRFKRLYANLKYKGKGVVLRANARGQSPQLGQLESLKIDLDYGLKGSADVLILNGTTGQRCRRPKADFWEPIDVSPVEFKFPTDEAFDAYLKKNCGFSLPNFSATSQSALPSLPRKESLPMEPPGRMLLYPSEHTDSN